MYGSLLCNILPHKRNQNNRTLSWVSQKLKIIKNKRFYLGIFLFIVPGYIYDFILVGILTIIKTNVLSN